MRSSRSVITVAPRPEWRDLLSLLTNRGAKSDGLDWPGISGTSIHPLSRAAWGLVAIAEFLRESLGRPPVFWFPGYFCNQSLAPLRGTSAIIRFYPVTEEAEPDWTACRRSGAEGLVPDAFILVHTFGFPTDPTEARAFADESGAWLIEDAAHMPSPLPIATNAGDAVLLSPYKTLPLPHGGLLVIRRDGVATAISRKVTEMGAGRPSSRSWLIRRALEAGLPGGLRRRLLARRGQLDFDADPDDSGFDPAPSLDTVSRRLMSLMGGKLGAFAEKRRLNASFLAAYPWPEGCVPFRNPEAPDVIPYRFVLRCRDHETARSLFDRLRHAGIPAESWPDLPPEVLTDGQRQAQAIALRRTLVLIPVHQDLSPDILKRALAAL